MNIIKRVWILVVISFVIFVSWSKASVIAQKPTARIAYVEEVYQDKILTIVDPDGKNRVEKMLGSALVQALYLISWSPDHSQLAVVRITLVGNKTETQIQILNGRGVVLRTYNPNDTKVQIVGSAPRPHFFGTTSWFGNNQLFLLGFSDTITQGSGLWLYDLKSNKVTQVVQSPGHGNYNSDPIVSPNGKFFAHVNYNKERQYYLVSANTEGPFPYGVLDPANKQIPSAYTIYSSVKDYTSLDVLWSSDSKTIANGRTLVNISDKSTKVLTDCQTQIVLARTTNKLACFDQNETLVSMDFDGNNLVTLFDEAIDWPDSNTLWKMRVVSWSPDDSMILFACEPGEGKSVSLCITTTDASKVWYFATGNIERVAW